MRDLVSDYLWVADAKQLSVYKGICWNQLVLLSNEAARVMPVENANEYFKGQ